MCYLIFIRYSPGFIFNPLFGKKKKRSETWEVWKLRKRKLHFSTYQLFADMLTMQLLKSWSSRPNLHDISADSTTVAIHETGLPFRNTWSYGHKTFQVQFFIWYSKL